jgi:hypothetical protein
MRRSYRRFAEDAIDSRTMSHFAQPEGQREDLREETWRG